jgi:Fur family peroxide stress response transcriptional regulator
MPLGIVLKTSQAPGALMFTRQQLVEQLRQWSVRVTPQRLAIAETVLNSTDHPTVQQIYERVRDHFPSMTLATIYSTLGVLEKSGFVQELPFQRMSRYEANKEPHVNLVCIECESVMDADAGHEAVARLRSRISSEAEFEVAWQRVDFYGWCPRCAARKRQEQPSQV